jgi:hypothetical protein
VASSSTGISSAKLGVSTIATTAALAACALSVFRTTLKMQDFAAAGIPVIVRLNNSFNSGNGAIVAGTP